MADLNPCVIWSGVEAPTTNHRATKAGADRDVEQIINATPCSERTLAEDRHLRVVLKERGEVERRADRPSEIRAWEVGSEVGWLNSDPAPRINRARRTDPNANQACDCCCVFDACRISCLLQRADACGDDGGRAAAHGSCACSTTNARTIGAHDRCANLRPAEIEGEDGRISGRGGHQSSVFILSSLWITSCVVWRVMHNSREAARPPTGLPVEGRLAAMQSPCGDRALLISHRS